VGELRGILALSCRANPQLATPTCAVQAEDLGGKGGGRSHPQAELANVEERLSDLAEGLMERTSSLDA
jgi:hypothetical protein